MLGLGFIFKLIPTYGNITRIAALLVGLFFPTLESMKAIESKQLGDDTQWLTYWVCYATLISLETVAWSFLIWVPFYRLIRIAALAWLVAPQTRGATYVYTEFVRPFLLVAVAKACEVPSLEPYFRDFASTKPLSSPAATSAKNFDTLKREAGQAVEDTFEKVTQSASAEEDDHRAAYQPLKAHAQ
ncbi:hypothetical protein D9Q98_004730 [Chlorella vulgaris]|uniref:HVA22-like protein n=1 Tax=Chlorella vulgaris TaxID=3077 RepID=A0A9D4TQH2_CHLVU|nr:hypothetical protein D9Q98_004730 [Chlorella vulgaris]